LLPLKLAKLSLSGNIVDPRLCFGPSPLVPARVSMKAKLEDELVERRSVVVDGVRDNQTESQREFTDPRHRRDARPVHVIEMESKPIRGGFFRRKILASSRPYARTCLSPQPCLARTPSKGSIG